MITTICTSRELAAIGRKAREKAPPVVAASTIGSWYWCPLKAWHSNTLFNTGWINPGELTEEETKGLATLWSIELAKRLHIDLIEGLLMHGEQVDVENAVVSHEIAGKLLENPKLITNLLLEKTIPSPGLIDPQEYSSAEKALSQASDIVEYWHKWKLIMKKNRGYVLIGIPDKLKWIEGGIELVEFKTTGNPYYVRRRMRTYKAAKAQLAAYTWMLIDRWPIERVILVFKERTTGMLVLREKYDPGELAEWFRESLLEIAEILSSTNPPSSSEKPPCSSCDYGEFYIKTKKTLLRGE